MSNAMTLVRKVAIDHTQIAVINVFALVDSFASE